MTQKNEIAWQAREFIHYPKKKSWFVIVTLLASSLTLYFLWQKDFLTGTLFFLMYLVTLFFAKQKPRQIKILLDEKGISIGEAQIPYQEIVSFWIFYDPPEIKTLNLETTDYINRNVTIQLENQDPVKIRSYLLDFIPENPESKERFSDKLSRRLKF